DTGTHSPSESRNPTVAVGPSPMITPYATVTSHSAVPVAPGYVAVTVAVPVATPRTTPWLLTAATSGSLVVQRAPAETSRPLTRATTLPTSATASESEVGVAAIVPPATFV